jgi:hypothetical protein
MVVPNERTAEDGLRNRPDQCHLAGTVIRRRIGIWLQDPRQTYDSRASANDAAIRPRVEIVLQLTQYTGKASGILQIGGWAVHSMTFPIAFHLLRVTATLLFACDFREAATDPECPLCIRKPPNRETIDAEVFDDRFLVTFAEDLAVDHPGRSSPTDRAVDDIHGETPKTKGTHWRPLSSLQIAVPD